MSFMNLDRPLRLIPIALGLALAAALPASAASLPAARAVPIAPQDGCAHTQASQVDADVLESQNFQRCGTGLVLLGTRLGLGGERCLDWRITTPSHQICTGSSLDDHYCTTSGDLDVIMETCSCDRYTIPFLEIGIAAPTCSCKTVFTGHIEDFETRPCPAPPTPSGT